MGAIFDDRAGYGTGPDLARLEKQLGEMAQDGRPLCAVPECRGGSRPAESGDAGSAMSAAPAGASSGGGVSANVGDGGAYPDQMRCGCSISSVPIMSVPSRRARCRC